MTKLELDISNLPPKQGSWLRCFRLALTIDKRTSCRTSIVIQTTNQKKYLFPLSQSLYWRPSADQKARTLGTRLTVARTQTHFRLLLQRQSEIRLRSQAIGWRAKDLTLPPPPGIPGGVRHHPQRLLGKKVESLMLPFNLVPRVLWLFGQRMGLSLVPTCAISISISLRRSHMCSEISTRK